MVLIYTIPFSRLFTLSAFFFPLIWIILRSASHGVKLFPCQISKLSFHSFYEAPECSLSVTWLLALQSAQTLDALKAFRNLMYANLCGPLYIANLKQYQPQKKLSFLKFVVTQMDRITNKISKTCK